MPEHPLKICTKFASGMAESRARVVACPHCSLMQEKQTVALSLPGAQMCPLFSMPTVAAAAAAAAAAVYVCLCVS